MSRKKKETYYVIDETDDDLICTEATSAAEAVKELFTPLQQEDGSFHVTVFKASDAQRFRLSAEVDIITCVEEVT